MAKLRVVALISGGKDSAFSILHCLANGHDVVALANLHPSMTADGHVPDDLESHMYQTVGHAVIPLYQDALALPLYRHEISGAAVNQEKSYRPSRATLFSDQQQDETESLFDLLQTVLRAHPDVNAVSSGAILSDYQRTRIESVAIRLGLTPLAYLWQYPRVLHATSLLEDMAAVGQDARIVKVASGGLDDSFLWQNVAAVRTMARLGKASQRFGTLEDGAMLGEGGEYETIAIDGPSTLWKRRIMVDEDALVVAAGDAGSSSVRITSARTTEKVTSTDRAVALHTPPLLGAGFAEMFERLKISASHPPATSPIEESADTISPSKPQDTTPEDLASTTSVLLRTVTGPGSTAAEQMTSIAQTVIRRLQQSGHTLSDITYTSIVLRKMDDFPAINATYGKMFEGPNPPARMTLACADVLSADSLVSVSITSTKMLAGAPRRDGLHVQSFSYWAPANIGPYSQAISVPSGTHADQDARIVYIAGQIALNPASMELATYGENDGQQTDFLHQAILSLQHLYRIGEATSVLRWVNALAFITAPSDEAARRRAAVCRSVWTNVCESEFVRDGDAGDEAVDFDVWDRRYGLDRTDVSLQTNSPTFETRYNTLRCSPAPELHVFRVDGLPRQAKVEWVAFGATDADPQPTSIPHWQHLVEVFARRSL